MEQNRSTHESSPAPSWQAGAAIPGVGPTMAAAPLPRASRWDRAADAPAPPPVWTRYIESRLRQFEEGR